MNTKCTKCGNTDFEMETSEIKGSLYKINFVRCSQCKSAVGVMDYSNPTYYIMKLAEKLQVSLDD